MSEITNLGINSVSTIDWLSVSKEFHIAAYHPGDLMSSFTANVRPILGEFNRSVSNPVQLTLIAATTTSRSHL
jgi:hypothetical protein